MQCGRTDHRGAPASRLWSAFPSITDALEDFAGLAARSGSGTTRRGWDYPQHRREEARSNVANHAPLRVEIFAAVTGRKRGDFAPDRAKVEPDSW
jgi:hypothetical protein